jgi:hypothetical protein
MLILLLMVIGLRGQQLQLMMMTHMMIRVVSYGSQKLELLSKLGSGIAEIQDGNGIIVLLVKPLMRLLKT